MVAISADYPPDFLTFHGTLTFYRRVWVVVNQSVGGTEWAGEAHPSESIVTDIVQNVWCMVITQSLPGFR